MLCACRAETAEWVRRACKWFVRVLQWAPGGARCRNHIRSTLVRATTFVMVHCSPTLYLIYQHNHIPRHPLSPLSKVVFPPRASQSRRHRPRRATRARAPCIPENHTISSISCFPKILRTFSPSNTINASPTPCRLKTSGRLSNTSGADVSISIGAYRGLAFHRHSAADQ